MLSQIEEMQVRRDILDEKECKFIIKYQILDIEGQVECLPMEIGPKRLSLHDYEIKFNANSKKIESIVNKNYGLVEFKAIELGNDIGGYLLGSKMQIFSTIYDCVLPNAEQIQMLNIVHIHLNDNSDEVTIDVAYMEDSQSV